MLVMTRLRRLAMMRGPLAVRTWERSSPPVSFSGTNFTTLTWNANPESDLVGYEVVMRETTVPEWTSAIPVGNVTTVTLNISKDNVQFGIRAVDQEGNRSPVAFPLAVA
jgi:hypothetical protein